MTTVLCVIISITVDYLLTRMHISRMCTSRFSSHLEGGVCVEGVAEGDVEGCVCTPSLSTPPAQVHAEIHSHSPSAQVHAGIHPPSTQVHAGIYPLGHSRTQGQNDRQV